MWFLGERVASIQKRRRGDLGGSCGNFGRRLENKSQEVGSQKKSEKEVVQVEILTHKEEQSLPEELHEVGSSYERVWCQQGPEKPMQWGCLLRRSLKLRRQMAAAAGKKLDLLWRHTALVWKKSSPPWPLSTGQMEYGQENGVTNQQKLG